MAMRTPAPVTLVVAPTLWMWRRHRTRKLVAVETAKSEARTATEIARLRKDLGIEDQTATQDAEPTTSRWVPDLNINLTRGWVFQHRRSLYPIPAALALTVLRLIVHTVPDGFNYASAAALLMPVVALAVAARWWTRQTTRFAGPAAIVSIAAIIWLIWPAACRIPVPVPASRWLILALATTATCLIRDIRFRTRSVEVEPVFVMPTDPAGRWAYTVGATGSLAGTYLQDVHRVISQDGTDVGWHADVVCTWGKHDASKVRSARESIVGAFGRDLADFAHERTGNALVARITVTEQDPFPTVLEAKSWLNDDGTFVVGSYADGKDCPMRLFTPGAGTHDLWFFGVKGSGKSTLVANALASVMSRGLVVLHLSDLKGGMSMPKEVREIAFRYGKSAAEGLMQLRRLDAIGEARMAECEQRGWTCMEPSEEWPIHLGLTEEAPQLWKIKEAVEIAEKIKTMYRAVLIALMDISQMARVKQAWGNSETLRTQAQAGNVGCGYVPKEEADLGFDHFKPDLSLIEKNSYHWFVTSPVESREVLVKVALVDWADVASKAVPGTPNPIDLAAVESVERVAREAMEKADQAKAAVEAGKIPEVGAEVTKELGAATLKRLAAVAGEPVMKNAIDRATYPGGELAHQAADEKAKASHADRVKYLLKQLTGDSTSGVTNPRFGRYAA